MLGRTHHISLSDRGICEKRTSLMTTRRMVGNDQLTLAHLWAMFKRRSGQARDRYDITKHGRPEGQNLKWSPSSRRLFIHSDHHSSPRLAITLPPRKIEETTENRLSMSLVQV